MVHDMTGGGTGAIGQVREGMTVVDAADEEIGAVRQVQMGDPQAVTTEGQLPGGTDSILEDVGEALTGSADVSPQAAAHLLRTGYLRIDRRGLASDLYASAEQVAEVTGDTVRLTAEKGQLYA